MKEFPFKKAGEFAAYLKKLHSECTDNYVHSVEFYPSLGSYRAHVDNELFRQCVPYNCPVKASFVGEHQSVHLSAETEKVTFVTCISRYDMDPHNTEPETTLSQLYAKWKERTGWPY